MGNLAFDISKIVDLNKTVNLDIDKNVEVTVDNPDILATAEADAEAFGTNALAEVDAFTYVSQDGGTPGDSEDVIVDIDALGNTTLTEQSNFNVPVDVDGDGVPDYFLPEDITVNFDTPDNTGLPDIDDLNWTGGLEGNDTISGADTPLPLIGEFEADDKVFNYDEFVSATPEPDGSVVITARYTLLEPWEVDFGPRTVTGNDLTDTQDLSLILPEGTSYLVEFLDEDGNPATGVEGFEAKEYEFEAFPAPDNVGQWVFGGQSFDIDTYVQDGEEIFDIGFGDWAFEALGTITLQEPPQPGDGEAFAYAESTAALDLNGNGTDAL